MRFADPLVLWALLGAPLLAVVMILLIRRRRRALESLIAPALQERMVAAVSTDRRLVKAGVACAAAAFLTLALARPQWGVSLESVARRGVDVVIAVDVSASMLAEDLAPSRVAKARSEASSLIDRLEGDRIGVVAFSGSAAILCPLTLDHAAARIFVDALEPGVVSRAGTSLGTALEEIAAAFGGREKRFRTAVILGDGEDLEGDWDGALAQAAEGGVVIHTVGVGTAAGGPIPLRDEQGRVTGYKEDREGRIVTTRLEEAALARIAERTGGLYLPASPGEGEIERIAEKIGAMDKRDIQQRLLTRFEERFQVPLALAIFLIVVEALIPERRRAARIGASKAAAALLVLLLAAAPAAASAASLVENGNRAFQEGRYDEALRLYTEAQVEAPDAPEIHLNIGNVLFRKGEYAKAREEYRRAWTAGERSLAGAARYNSGTSSLSAGEYRDAVTDYHEALKMDPEDADARRNLELALMRLKEQQPPKGGPPKENQQEGRQQSPSASDPNQGPQQPERKDESAGSRESPRGGEGEQRAPSAADRKARQEAERILDALRSEDRPRIDPREQRHRDRPPEKDW